MNNFLEFPCFKSSAFPKINGVDSYSSSLKAPLGYLIAQGPFSLYSISYLCSSVLSSLGATKIILGINLKKEISNAP